MSENNYEYDVNNESIMLSEINGNVVMESTLARLQKSCEEKLLKIYNLEQSTRTKQLELEAIEKEIINPTNITKLKLDIAEAEHEIGNFVLKSSTILTGSMN